MGTILHDIEKYWSDRADGYCQVNQEEFQLGQDQIWLEEIRRHLPEKENLKILDIGTGPGFFAILLARAGYYVTAVDYTEAMLNRARENAGEVKERIVFCRMDAQELTFADETFDVVLSRNLTWNLERPDAAYKEWCRVLKPEGVLLNFDANWYHYLFDDEKRREYEKDRRHVELCGAEDYYTCTNIERMEAIARMVPLSKIMRPSWDLEILRRCGMRKQKADGRVWERVWSEMEKLNYRSTPMFLIEGVK